MKSGRWLALTLLLVAGNFLAASTRTAGSENLQGTPDALATAADSSPTADISAFAAQVAGAPHKTVKSTDGRVTLLIPEGALPAGVASSSIRITPIAPGRAPLKFSDKPPLFAYRMEPDGLRFSTPALLQIVTSWSRDGNAPMLFLTSDQEVEALASVLLEVDVKSRKITITAPLEHFSVIASENAFQLVVSDPSAHVLGDPFSVQAQITRLIKDLVSNEPNEQTRLTLKYNPTWELAGTWQTSAALSPAAVYDAPPNTQTSTDTFTLKQPFTCKVINNTVRISYTASIVFRSVITYMGKSKNDSTRLELKLDTQPFPCVHLVTRFMARFLPAERATRYEVFASDPDGDKLKYQWSLEGNACGSFTWEETSPEAVWTHPHTSIGGNCPEEAVHPGTIKVTVSDGHGATQTVTYSGGSASGILKEDDFPSYVE